jgi:seryl-tRNA synthetase
MLDLKFIRQNPQIVRQAIADRQTQAPLDKILTLDKEARAMGQQLDTLKRRRKVLAREWTSEAQEEGRHLRDKIRESEDELRKLDSQLKDLLLQVPNMPDPLVPVGKDEGDNKILRSWGKLPGFSFNPKPHWELGDKLDIIDIKRGVKLSGLQRALIAFFLNLHTAEHGYKEIYPPYMVKRECMIGSGNLPKFADNLYHDEIDDFWFVPTAEVPLTNLHRDEIIAPGMLPFYYVAYTACFRREKMSAGKDTRGIKRGHQFDKVELYKFTETGTSNDELEKLLANAETVCKHLKLPYRIKQLCTADLGFVSAISYDIEMWAPGLAEWLEVSSCSNCKDFQARRSGIRYRPTPESKPEFVHTLNGSGLALPRVLIAVLENYQQDDGSIKVPEVLQEFMGVEVIK